MRVIQVINHAGTDRGGAERLARELHADLVTEGLIDAHLIALEDCDLGDLPNARSFGLPSSRDPRATLRLDAALRGLVRPGDVIHAHLFPATLHVAVLRHLRRLPEQIMMTEHNTWNRRRDLRLGRMLDRSIYAAFQRIAVISAQTETALLDSHPQLAKRTQVVENGARLLFSAFHDRPAAPQTPTILSVGRLATAKNYPKALHALTRITDMPWHYMIAGDGPDREDLLALTRHLGLSERVTFLGQVADLEPVLAQADIFLMPSAWEGFGLAAVEAMNAGLPVVASDVPGLRELVAPTGAHLVPPDNDQAIAEALAHLLSSPDQRRALGQKGFDRAAHYGKQRMTLEYIKLWRDAVGGDLT